MPRMAGKPRPWPDSRLVWQFLSGLGGRAAMPQAPPLKLSCSCLPALSTPYKALVTHLNRLAQTGLHSSLFWSLVLL